MTQAIVHFSIQDEDLQELRNTYEREECSKSLGRIFKCSEAKAELYFYVYVLGREREFSNLKMKTCLTLCQDIIESKEEMNASFERLKVLLYRHSIERPPKSVGVFSGEDISAIAETLLTHFYRHYRLYSTLPHFKHPEASNLPSPR